MAKHAQLKLEIVFFVYLWSIDVDAVKTAMSCFSLFCEEAEIRFGFDETAITQILPNHNVYIELSATSNNTLATGRNALQKKILSLLRKIEHPTQGNKQAWYDTFVYQQTLTKLLYSYPKTTSNKSSDSKNDESGQEGASNCNTPVILLNHHNRLSHNKRQRNSNNTGGTSGSMSGSSITVSNNVTSSSMGGGSNLALSTSNYSNLGNSFNNSNVNSLSMNTSSVNTTLNSSSLSGMIYSQEHDLEDILAEWANMTGFLSAMGSVWLPCKQVVTGGKQETGIVGREASSYLLMGRTHNTSIVSF
jgi:hypothetical protein